MTVGEKLGFPSIPPVLVGLPAWYELLIVDDNGHARAIAKNAETALENDPAFAGAIRRQVPRADDGRCAAAVGSELVGAPAVGRHRRHSRYAVVTRSWNFCWYHCRS